MAGIPLNTFKTYTKTVPYLDPTSTTPPGLPIISNPYFVYQAPPGTTGIVLYLQVANTDLVATHASSAWHYRPSALTYTNIVLNVPCPVADTRIMLGGKLVLETGDMLYVSTDDISGTYMKMIASLLESANQ
jgi:hypothetical protein